MGKSDYYKHRDWNVECDRCGEKRKASDCRLTWENLFVCSDTCWEPRHPQDFVRGRLDKQTVPITRPDTQEMSTTTTLSSGASAMASSVVLTSVSGVYDGTSLGITLDNGEVQWVHATDDPTGSTVLIHPQLRSAAASGNSVYVMAGDRFLTDNQVTASGL